MELEILKMGLSDLEDIKENLNTDFDDFWSYSVLKDELENKNNLDSHYIVAKINNDVVGFAGVTNIIDEVNIMNIVVRKDKRKTGIGSKLLEEILDISKSLEAASITLEVNSKNIPAIGLYKKYGFIEVGYRKKYYNNTDDAILMTKTN